MFVVLIEFLKPNSLQKLTKEYKLTEYNVLRLIEILNLYLRKLGLETEGESQRSTTEEGSESTSRKDQQPEIEEEAKEVNPEGENQFHN